MRYHHHEHNFLRGVVENEDVLGDDGFFDDVFDVDDDDSSSPMSHRAKARKMVEEHLENRRNKLRDSDPFEDEHF